jgi:outer membrane protein assembly factor BamB
MEGEVLHQWRHPYRENWPVLDPDHKDPAQGNSDYWRRTFLFENGDLLAIFDGLALLKIDRYSNLIWAYRGGFHHDLDVIDDGRIFVLTHREITSHPSLPDHSPIIEDFITLLNADGSLIRHVSILESFVRSKYAALLDRVREPVNVFHTNTLEVLKGRLADRSEAFKAGNVLVSLRDIDVVAVVDLEQEKVVWAITGDWKMQHQPTVLDNGNMLLFDNQGHHGTSKVIEFDPLTQQTVWAYKGDDENGFYSPVLGSNQRLPNGNTLITESCAGRAFVVAPEGAVVWDFIDSKRIGPEGQWQLVPTMCEMVRIEKDYVRGWLDVR